MPENHRNGRILSSDNTMAWRLTDQKDWQDLEAQFPFVRDMQDVPQDPRRHAEGSVAVHTRMVLDTLPQLEAYPRLSPSEKEILWTSALLHDVEKRSTTILEASGTLTSRGHERRAEQTTRELLYRFFPAPFAVREQIAKLVRYHELPFWVFEKRDPLQTLSMASLEVDTRLVALLAEADVRGRIGGHQTRLLERLHFFRAYCRQNDCWARPRHFPSGSSRFRYFRTPIESAEEDPVCEVILLSGLPGTGKDTYAARQLADWPVVSMDNFRRERGIDANDREGNDLVAWLAKEKARSLLEARTSFVWNATNLTRQTRRQLIDLFVAYKARVKVVYLEVPYPRLMRQNSNRDYVVPTDVVHRMIKKLEVPASWEAHEVVYEVQSE